MTLRLNSAYRTVVQQHILFSWQGSECVSIAAKPGRSNHEDGFAIDTSDWREWRSALEAESWEHFGDGDEVHFTFIGGGVRDDIGDIGVKAFQILWNKHNPNDQIDVDGDYGPQTAARLDRAPANGFARARILKLLAPPMEGEDVRQVQQALLDLALLKTEQVNGVYNEATKLAIEIFQKRSGLGIDGQVGPQTRRLFKGRGFVQITGRRNYGIWTEKLGIDLVGNPEKAALPEIAAIILVRGMRDGSFTGVGLSDFIVGDRRDFFNARRIVNGLNRADHIEQIAKAYFKAII